jgi:hypothetical protein
LTLVDDTAPAVTCSAPVTAECSGNGTATATTSATAQDNCAGPLQASGPGSATYPLGTTHVNYTAIDPSGNAGSCSTSVTVVDTTPPVVTCTPSVNPSGQNIPKASNEDGFYRVGATDSCTNAGLAIRIGTYTLGVGETIKITQTPGKSGVRLVNTMGPAAIKHFQVGPGDATITATDGAGNAASVTCLVPPPPK